MKQQGIFQNLKSTVPNELMFDVFSALVYFVHNIKSTI